MRTWTERSNEVAYLLNPAFCCAMLTSSVLDYTSIKSEGMDYPLVFMVLPIILHAPTRKALPPNISTTWQIGFKKITWLLLIFIIELFL
jgi:hypothetical protein